MGHGPDRAEIEDQLRPLGDRVIFTGHQDDVMRVLDAVDVLLHPSRVDAFPTALLEAMAAGVPVVASAAGGIPEIIENGVTGVLVPAPPSVDELVRGLGPVLDDRGTRVRLAEAGRARYCRDFTAEQWARRLRSVYDQVLQERRR
jgi:glycosyltransferase involved in cell wall biosynthesis